MFLFELLGKLPRPIKTTSNDGMMKFTDVRFVTALALSIWSNETDTMLLPVIEVAREDKY